MQLLLEYLEITRQLANGENQVMLLQKEESLIPDNERLPPQSCQQKQKYNCTNKKVVVLR